MSLPGRQTFFVASARKAQVLKAALKEAGEAPDQVDALVAPAGQLLGAQTPEEIALSVLAAVVAARRGQTMPPSYTPRSPSSPEPQVERQIESQIESQIERPAEIAPPARAGGSCCGS